MLKVEANGIGLLLILGGLSISATKTVSKNVKLRKENDVLKAENSTLNKAIDIYEIANNALSRELDEYEKKFGKLE